MRRFELFILFVFIMLLMVSLVSCDKGKKEKTTEQGGIVQQRLGLDEQMMLEVTSTVDGGAYAYAQFGSGIWYLRGTEAVRVKEVSAFSSFPEPVLLTEREKALWTQLQKEIAKRKEAEEKLAPE